nr:S1C family serine protease [Pseudomonadota bacterium]
MTSRFPVLFLVCALLSLPGPALAQEAAIPASREQIAMSFSPIVKTVAPAVVNIYTRRVVRQQVFSPFMNDPFFREFFGQSLPGGLTRERVQNSLGSGVIVAADGLIVTNAHVIKGADEIRVGLSDRREFTAEVVLTDTRTDLA